jgi:hypothetical protein
MSHSWVAEYHSALVPNKEGPCDVWSDLIGLLNKSARWLQKEWLSSSSSTYIIIAIVRINISPSLSIKKMSYTVEPYTHR